MVMGDYVTVYSLWCVTMSANKSFQLYISANEMMTFSIIVIE